MGFRRLLPFLIIFLTHLGWAADPCQDIEMSFETLAKDDLKEKEGVEQLRVQCPKKIDALLAQLILRKSKPSYSPFSLARSNAIELLNASTDISPLVSKDLIRAHLTHFEADERLLRVLTKKKEMRTMAFKTFLISASKKSDDWNREINHSVFALGFFDQLDERKKTENIILTQYKKGAGAETSLEALTRLGPPTTEREEVIKLAFRHLETKEPPVSKAIDLLDTIGDSTALRVIGKDKINSVLNAVDSSKKTTLLAILSRHLTDFEDQLIQSVKVSSNFNVLVETAIRSTNQKAFKDKIETSFPEPRPPLVKTALFELGKKKYLLDVVKQLDSPNSNLATVAIDRFIRANPKADKIVRDMARKALFKGFSEKNLCTALCGLVKNSKEWLDSKYSEAELFGVPTMSHQPAVLLLQSLFLMEAEPFCKELKGFSQDFLSRIVLANVQSASCPSTGVIKDSFSDILSLGKYLPDISRRTNIDERKENSSKRDYFYTDRYSNQFYLLALRKISDSSFANEPSIKAVLERKILEARQALTDDLKNYQNRKSNRSSNLMTWGWAMAVDADYNQPDEKVKSRLPKLVASLKNKQEFPYYPEIGYPTRQVPDSVTTAVTTYWTLMRNETDLKKKEYYEDLLMDAVKNWFDYTEFAQVHFMRPNTHLTSVEVKANKQGFAPYFYPAGLEYAAKAIVHFNNKGILNEDDVSRFTADTLLMLEKKGLFFPMGGRSGSNGIENEYKATAPSYTNPLFGRALVILAKGRCKKIAD